MKIDAFNIYNFFSKIDHYIPPLITRLALAALAGYACICYINRKYAAKRADETSFKSAAESGSVDKVKELIKEKPHLINYIKREETSLINDVVLRDKQFAVADVLVENGLDLNNVARNMTALECAAYFGEYGTVKWLLEKRINPNYRMPLIKAIESDVSQNPFETIALLLKYGADPNSKDGASSPLYLMAVRYLNTHPEDTKKIIQLMRTKGAVLREKEQNTEIAQEIEKIKVEVS